MIPSTNQQTRPWLLWAMLLLLVSATALAATTGNLTGYVLKPDGSPAAGVSVSITGPSLQGTRTVATDSQGFFRATQIPPGEDYRVHIEGTGFRITERTGVAVHIDETIKLPTIKLQGVQSSGAIEVVEEAPLVEQGNTAIGRTLTNEFLSAVPTGRTTTAVLALAPGATSDALGVSFRGATSPENSYIIDGLNTTGIIDGLPTSELPPEFVQEVQVKTGGYEAEYGRATGGQAIVITKSGGNEFHGDVFAYVTPIYGRAHSVVTGEDDPSTPQLEASLVSKATPQLDAQIGFDLGGYIIKDRLWFFAGYAPTLIRHTVGHEIVQSPAEDPDLTSNAITDSYQSIAHYYLANLTFNISQEHALRFSASGSPFTADGAIYRPAGDPGTYMGTQHTGAFDYNLSYNGKYLDGKINLDAVVGYHVESGLTSPFTGEYQSLSQNSFWDGMTINGEAPQIAHENYLDYVPGSEEQCLDSSGITGQPSPYPCIVFGYLTGGSGYLTRTSAQRIVAKPVLSIFVNNLVGNHVIKLGGDLEHNHLTDARTYSGGAYVTARASSYYEQWFSDSGVPTPWLGTDNEASYFTATTNTINTSAFLQDSWSILSNLSLDLGVRWERQQIQDNFGISRIDIKDNIAPRVGVIFDYTNQGKSKLFANFGRYYESIPQDINDRALSAEGFNLYRYARDDYDENMAGQQPLTDEYLYSPLGGEQTPIQKNLKGQYSDQFLVGFQQEVVRNLALGITGIYQRLGNVIEDISPDNGYTYLIANPGSADFGYLVVPSTVDADGNITYHWDEESQEAVDADGNAISFSRCIAANDPLTGGPVTYCFPKASRTYQAIELTLEKRLSNNWQGQASYTISQTFGNYPGLFSASNGQLDPNITSQFDLPNLLTNRTGYLDQDRRHNIKVAGAYTFNFGTSLGLVASLESGAPIVYLGAHSSYGNGEAFLLPRGVVPSDLPAGAFPDYVYSGRTPWIVQIDASAHHTLTFASKRSLALGLQLNNLLNLQPPTRIDQNYTYDVGNPVAGGSSAGQITCYDPNYLNGHSQCAVNPGFGKATAYQAPFNLRFEAKFSF